jgi:UDP-glucose 4-epimerase
VRDYIHVAGNGDGATVLEVIEAARRSAGRIFR